jgi:hypothetical protein
MTLNELLRVTVNVSALALIYTFIGALASFIIYHIVDEYNDDWKKQTLFYKMRDVVIELSIIAFIAFWSSYLIIIFPQILYVRPPLDDLIDNYGSNIFYLFAIFIFLDGLTEKLKFLYNEYLGPSFEKIFPQYGSITNLTLSYYPRKTDQNNSTHNSQQWSAST